MVLKYTTVNAFWKFLGVAKNVMFAQPGTTPSKDTIATYPVSAGTYYLTNPGVDTDSLRLYVGSTGTSYLTPNTDYTFDSDTNEVVLNSTGAAKMGTTNSLVAGYWYTTLSDVMNYNATTTLLEQAEEDFEHATNVVFADQGSTNPAYTQISDERTTSLGWNNNIYYTQYFPIVKLSTTVSSAYTKGGTTLEVASSYGFPASGTIYVDGNEVSYTSYSGNILTVPSITPTIASGGKVRGEVVKVDLGAPGSEPAFQVLQPDVDYAIDHDTGAIQVLGDLYLNLQYAASRATPGYLDRLRFTYLHAWHEVGRDCTIPPDVVQCVHFKAAQDLQARTILKAGVGDLDNFNPNTLRAMDDFIQKKIEGNRCVRVHRC